MAPPATPCVAVHGGAGDLPQDDAVTGHPRAARLEGVRQAAALARGILLGGGSALEAVVAAVAALEDNPVFNAGTGAALTAVGDVELDASVMDGATLEAGAVAAVKDSKNPVRLAQAVMARSGHVLLVGAGASDFAREIGLPAVHNSTLVTAAQRARYRAARCGPDPAPCPGGTVGAVARDARGHLAAATSTGGTFLKRPGRVGDTALIGCGTYADDALAAVSATGEGERIIRVTLARTVADLVGSGLSGPEAAQEGVRRLETRLHGQGGLIVMPPRGEPGLAHNTPAMPRAWTAEAGEIRTGL